MLNNMQTLPRLPLIDIVDDNNNIVDEKWVVGAIFGGQQWLSSYYICLVKLRKVDGGWDVDGEQKVELVAIENKKNLTPKKMLENVWSNLAGREDMAKVEFLDRYLSLESGKASLVNIAARGAIHKKMVELGKFVSAFRPKAPKRHRGPPKRLTYSILSHIYYISIIILIYDYLQCLMLQASITSRSRRRRRRRRSRKGKIRLPQPLLTTMMN